MSLILRFLVIQSLLTICLSIQLIEVRKEKVARDFSEKAFRDLSVIHALKYINQVSDNNVFTLHNIINFNTKVLSGVKVSLVLDVKQRGACVGCKRRCKIDLLHDPEKLNQFKLLGIPLCSGDTKKQPLPKFFPPLTSMRKNEYERNFDDSYTAFLNYIEKYNKSYVNREEHIFRYSTFQVNMLKAKQFQIHEMGSAVYGATQFADWTEEEYRMHAVNPKWQRDYSMTQVDVSLPETLPDSFDWRDHGAVTKVKNQGSCGSCWAFSTTGNIEGQWAIQKKKLVSLSEQELVDCDKVDKGCQGGLPSNAYKEIIRLGGLETEKEYPYEAENDKCSFVKADAKVYINGSIALPQDETKLAAWLIKNGPISIGINANAMQWYFGGISHPWKIFCNPSNLDHGVLIVGFGKRMMVVVEGNKPYWIIKNSWGPTWGEKGYYLVYRGAGVCGLNTMATSATIN